MTIDHPNLGVATGIEYPWNKYAQIVGRDYVSGAMENTTAVIHGEKAYQVPGELIDKNVQENVLLLRFLFSLSLFLNQSISYNPLSLFFLLLLSLFFLCQCSLL